MASDLRRDFALGLRTIRAAQRTGAHLRLAGSCAVVLVSGADVALRPHAPKDVDFVALRRQREVVQTTLSACGWVIDRRRLLEFDLREFFIHPTCTRPAEVFYDFIDGNHPTDIRKSITNAFPTLDWPTLFISKVQRRELRPNDIWDIFALLQTSTAERHVAQIGMFLADDWGLYTTIMENLQKLADIDGSHQLIIRALMERARNEPKSFKWQARALIGRRLRWWQTVST